MATKTKETFLPEVDSDVDYEFELVSKEKPVNYGIGTQYVAYDNVAEEETHLRYVPGYKSIIKDEQPDIEEKFVPSYDINFSRGKLVVSGKQKQLVQFLMLHPGREGNKNAIIARAAEFKLINKQDEINATRNLIASKRDAVDMAEKANSEEMYPYARVIGVSIVKTKGEKDSDYENRVRTKFMEKAYEMGQKFIDGFDDPKHKREYDVILGFEQGILDDSKDREIIWANSKETIVKLPASGATSIKFLTDFSLTEKGADFYQALKKQISY